MRMYSVCTCTYMKTYIVACRKYISYDVYMYMSLPTTTNWTGLEEDRPSDRIFSKWTGDDDSFE